MPFNTDGSVFIAMIVALVCWLGIFTLIWRMDRQARDLRRRLDATEQPQQRAVAPRATLEPRQRADAPVDVTPQG